MKLLCVRVREGRKAEQCVREGVRREELCVCEKGGGGGQREEQCVCEREGGGGWNSVCERERERGGGRREE